MRRHETFSYLPRLGPDEVEAQIRDIVDRRLVVAVEYESEERSRSPYWSLWRLPLFGVDSTGPVLAELDACRRENPGAYVRLSGYDPLRQGQVACFVVHRPEDGE